MSDQPLKLLEERVALAAERLRELAAERDGLRAELERLGAAWEDWRRETARREEELLAAARDAVALLRED